MTLAPTRTAGDGLKRGLPDRLTAASAFMLATVGCVAAAGLIGWILDIDALKRVAVNHIAINPTSSVCMLLIAFALATQLRGVAHGATLRVAGKAAAALCLTVGAVKCFEVVTGVEPVVDQILFRSKVRLEVTGPNRMAALTALNFVLNGLAVLLLDWRTRRGWWPAQILGVLSGYVALLALLDIVYGFHATYRPSMRGAMALNTACAFLLVSAALLCSRPERGVLGILRSPAAEMRSMRRLLVGVMLAPSALGGALIAGERYGLYATDFGVSLAAITLTAAIGLILTQNITAMHRTLQRRIELESEVQSTAAALAGSNRDLEEFAYIASHDLRAPLRAIKNLAEWISEDLGERLDPENRERMELLLGRARRLDRLIDDLLQYSRAGRATGAPQRLDANELVDEIAAMLSPPRGMVISRECDLPTLETVVAPLELVLRNLISNAIKHHDKPTGRVSVGWRDAGDFHEFCVRDDGPGIAAEYHERVFRMFETLQPRDKVEGSGMGLAVVKRTVEKLGGAVRVESALGQGATFYFTWPKATPAITPGATRPTPTAEARASRELAAV